MNNQLALIGGTPVRKNRWRPWPAADRETEEVLLDVLYSERWALSGNYNGRKSYNKKFSQAFAQFCGVPYCITTSSGSSALLVSLRALNIKQGDEVIVPGNTWVACASAVIQLGAVPVLVDVEPDRLSISVDSVKKHISQHTKAVIVVHQSCSFANMSKFVQFSNQTNIPIIEDCSQAHGAKLMSRRVGSFGAMGVFSTQDSKVLTSGEGGIIVTSSSELFSRCSQIRADGRATIEHKKIGFPELKETGNIQGFNFNLSEFQAAILTERLKHLDIENATRRANALILKRQLSDMDEIELLFNPSDEFEQCIYQLALRINRDAFNDLPIPIICEALSCELGANVEHADIPLNRSPLLFPFEYFRLECGKAQKYHYDPSRYHLPNADNLSKNLVLLPHYMFLGDEADMKDITTALKKVSRLSYLLTK